MSMTPVIDALADNNAPIESLRMDGLNPRITESVERLTNIQKLVLYRFSYEMVFDLVTKLPALQEFDISVCAHISLNGIKRILEAVTSLKSLCINEPDLLVDSVELTNSILGLATDRRVKVQIFVRHNNISIQPEPYFNPREDERWLTLVSSLF